MTVPNQYNSSSGNTFSSLPWEGIVKLILTGIGIIGSVLAISLARNEDDPQQQAYFHLNLSAPITHPIDTGFCRRGKLEVAGNEGHKQAGKADRTAVPLRQNPLAIGSVAPMF